ncbi:MAG: 2-amino-4-hydroxy-6-hydroxymethyldihydropteridine diphosphokinase [Psychromonas sp.]
MAQVFIGVGSSINRMQNVRLAIQALQDEFGMLRVSKLYESEAVGFSGGNFYNLVVELHTECNTQAVVSKLKLIEKKYGRPEKTVKFAPRTLDLDLLLYGQKIETEIDLPRAEILKNAFVLKPLSELAPNLKHPILDKTYQTLWQEYPQKKQKLWQIELLEP